MHISYLRVIVNIYQKIVLEKWESKNAQNSARFAVCSSYSPMLYVYVIFSTIHSNFFNFIYFPLTIKYY